jgi:hypothetical protein
LQEAVQPLDAFESIF